MANERNQNVWRVDTTGDVTSDLADVQSIRWVGGQSGDEVEIADADGNIVWSSIAAANDFVDNDNSIDLRLPGGFSVPTLDGGILYVYVRARGV